MLNYKAVTNVDISCIVTIIEGSLRRDHSIAKFEGGNHFGEKQRISLATTAFLTRNYPSGIVLNAAFDRQPLCNRRTRFI